MVEKDHFLKQERSFVKTAKEMLRLHDLQAAVVKINCGQRSGLHPIPKDVSAALKTFEKANDEVYHLGVNESDQLLLNKIDKYIHFLLHTYRIRQRIFPSETSFLVKTKEDSSSHCKKCQLQPDQSTISTQKGATGASIIKHDSNCVHSKVPSLGQMN